MKKIVLLLMAATASVACHRVPEGMYEIEGRIGHVEDGVVVRLFRMNGVYGEPIATDTLADGRFSFQIRPESDAKEHLFIGCPDHEQFPMMCTDLWATAGDRIRIEGDGPLFYTYRVRGQAPEIASSQGFIHASRELWEEVQRCNIEQRRIRAQAKKGSQEERMLLKNDFDRLEQRSDSLKNRIHERSLQRMQQQPVDAIWIKQLSILAGWLKEQADHPLRPEVEALYHSLGEEWKNDPTVQAIAADLYPPERVKVGEPMIDGELFDLAGTKHTLAELKGNYLLIDLWSSGCGPCVAAIPEMGELAERYKGRLQIVSISSDTDEVWRNASTRHPMSWHNWNDGKRTTGIFARYEQRGIPAYTLISPDGTVLAQWTGYGKGSLKKRLAEYLK